MRSWLAVGALGLGLCACDSKSPSAQAPAGACTSEVPAASACGSEQQPAQSASVTTGSADAECALNCAAREKYSTAEVVEPTTASIGDLTHCPVSEVVFRVNDGSPRVQHGGQSRFVCCDRCADRFNANPERFQGS